MDKQVHSFLDRHYRPDKPILLAFSGGPDSLALLHLLLSYEKPLKLHLAHLDHGWRQESKEEAQALQKFAQTLNLPFHLKRLEQSSASSNLEALGRMERLKFFKELTLKYDFQAVLLGHHADDQSETVLKRILEGASFVKFSALQEISEIEELCLWRPLLPFCKKELAERVKKSGWQPLEDSTNLDCRFLRNRLRHEILPALSTAYGKEVQAPLYRLSQEMKELQLYLDEQLEPYWNKRLEGPFGIAFNCFSPTIIPQVLLKHLLRKLAFERGISFSHQKIATLCQLISQKMANKQVLQGSACWRVDRGWLFDLNFEPSKLYWPSNISLEEGMKGVFGAWQIEVKHLDQTQKTTLDSWQTGWRGEFLAALPKGNYHLGAPHKSPLLDRWWTQYKVPAFLRPLFPVVYRANTPVHEFLTGRLLIENKAEWLVTLKLIDNQG